MEEIELKMSEKELQRMYNKIMMDDTRWDLMTGTELNKRIKAYKADKGNTQKLISLMGCLRLAEVLYPYKQDGESFSMPTLPLPEGAMIMVFTTKAKCKAESLKQYRFNTATIANILDSVGTDEIKYVCINPLIDDVIIPIDPLKHFIEMADNIVSHIDEQMVEGIEFKDLDPITFERFGGKRVEVKTAYGREIVGEACAFYDDKTLGPCLTIETDDKESIELYFNQVERIKDITDYGEPDGD